jgi:outer membrane protein assembly factor BamB
MYKDTVIVTASDEAQSLVGLDAATGKERWKEEAEMLDSIWGTPALAKSENGAEIVLAVPGEIWGFNADTGKLRWYAPGNDGASHSIVVDNGIAYSIGGGRGGSNGVAVKVGQKGEVEDLVWENRASGRFSSALVYENRLYSVSGGVLSAFDAKTGKKIFEKRLPSLAAKSGDAEAPPSEGRGGRRGGRGGRGGFGGMEYASPIIVGGNIYVLTKSGGVHVLGTGDEYKVVGKGDLTFDKSGFDSTPAASDGQLLIRSNSHLYCISE